MIAEPQPIAYDEFAELPGASLEVITTEFDLSEVCRRMAALEDKIASDKKTIEKLVDRYIEPWQKRIEYLDGIRGALRDQIQAWLEATGKQKLNFPDIGRVNLSTQTKVDTSMADPMALAERYKVTRTEIDKAALRKALIAQFESDPTGLPEGVEVKKVKSLTWTRF